MQVHMWQLRLADRLPEGNRLARTVSPSQLHLAPPAVLVLPDHCFLTAEGLRSSTATAASGSSSRKAA